jgi:cell division septum initiation protein DivIVA
MSQKKKRESALGRGLDALIRTQPVEEPETPGDDEEDIETTLEEENPLQRKNSSAKNRKPAKTSGRSSARTTLKTENAQKPKTSRPKKEPKPMTEDFNVDSQLLEEVMAEVAKNPRISLWSAKSAAVLRYLRKTKPAFSISKEASALIEDAVKEKYPDLWEIFEGEGL